MSAVTRDEAAVARPRGDFALFLDLDGTLIEIAPTPSSVRVPPHLPALIQSASGALSGAVAIVSGRPFAEAAALIAPASVPLATEHGAVIRLPDGTVEEEGARVPDEWVDALVRAAAGRAGVLIERKSFSVAIHFRLAPEAEGALMRVAEHLVAQDGRFELLPARMAFEIRATGVCKGGAVRRLMRDAPFKGRVPVFIGDDVTDEDGMRAAREAGGWGVKVGGALFRAPGDVLNWLESVGKLTSTTF